MKFKKREPFSNFLPSYKKDQHTTGEPNRNMFHSLFFFICTRNRRKASVVIFAKDQATFAPFSVDHPSFLSWRSATSSVVVVRVATVIVLEDGSGSWVFPFFQVDAILMLSLQLI